MNTLKTLLILLTALFLLSSCLASVSYRDRIVYKTAPIEKCHDEDDIKNVEYKQLDRIKYIAEPENIDKLLDNLQKMKEQNDKQRAAIICYDERITKNNEEAKKEDNE